MLVVIFVTLNLDLTFFYLKLVFFNFPPKVYQYKITDIYLLFIIQGSITIRFFHTQKQNFGGTIENFKNKHNLAMMNSLSCFEHDSATLRDSVFFSFKINYFLFFFLCQKDWLFFFAVKKKSCWFAKEGFFSPKKLVGDK